MRIRSIKPEFWRSQDITSLDWEARLLFIGLWSYVDDNGVGKDHEPSIVGDLFATDMFDNPRETVARVSRGLQKLAEAGRIARYDTEKGKCLYITNWSKHQRIDKPNRPRLDPPPPELQASGGDSRECRESVARPQEIPAPGTGEQRNRGTEEQRIEHSSIADANGPHREEIAEVIDEGPTEQELFDTFWDNYPRKDAKKQARAKFKTALKRATAEEIIEGAHRYNTDPNREQAFTKQPTTWLNGDHWEDPPLPARSSGRTTAADDRLQRGLDIIGRRMDAGEQGRLTA